MSQTLSAPMAAPRSTRQTDNIQWPVAVAVAVLVLAHVPLLWAHMHVLLLKPHYEFFPLVFVGSAVLAWPAYKRVRAGHRPGPTGRTVGLALLALNWLMLTTAVVINSPWIGMVSFLELMATVAMLAGGWPTLRAAVPALIYLVLVIPPPWSLDGKIVLGLQGITSRVSSRVLDRMNILHFLDGNLFEVGPKKYFVDKACSGINSLFSTIAVTLFCVLYFGAHWLRTILLFLAVVFWVVVANVTRITLIVWLDGSFGIDLSKEKFDWAKNLIDNRWTFAEYIPGPHSLLGFALFGMVLAMMYSTNRFLMFLGTTVRWGDAAPLGEDDLPVPADVPPSRTIGWGIIAPALAAYGVLVLFQAGEYELGAPVTESALVDGYNKWTEDDLPERIGVWTRQKGGSTFEARDRDNPFGKHSRTWQYRTNSGMAAVISFDYPFPTWHDLRLCYTSIGWRMESTDTFDATIDGAKAECVRFNLIKEFERRGYGWFTEFDQTGKPIPVYEPLGKNYVEQWSERFNDVRDRWLSLFGKAKAPPNFLDVLQVQVLVENPGPLSNEAIDLCQTFFLQSTELIRVKCQAGAATRSTP